MQNQEIKFESQGGLKVIQLVWLGLLVIVMLSLAISNFVIEQQVWYINLLALCMILILMRMSYMNYKCCQYLNIRLIIKDNTLHLFTDTNETRYELHNIMCNECAVSSVYTLSDNKGNVIAYINSFLPNSKKLVNAIQNAAK
jgi:hypothetical protein